MFTNIAIIASGQHANQELVAIRHQLRNPMRFTFREFLSIEDLNRGLNNFPFDILLMRLSSFEAHHVRLIFKVRQRFANAGLVTIAEGIDASAAYQIKDVFRHKLLNERMEMNDLVKVIDKLGRGEAASARMHPRVPRKGECELVEGEKGERMSCRFLDFAQMGARLILHPRTPLKRNSRYQLHYRSTTEPNRVHRIESSVVWAEVQSGMMGTIIHGPEQVVGLRFIAAL